MESREFCELMIWIMVIGMAVIFYMIYKFTEKEK